MRKIFMILAMVSFLIACSSAVTEKQMKAEMLLRLSKQAQYNSENMKSNAPEFKEERTDAALANKEISVSSLNYANKLIEELESRKSSLSNAEKQKLKNLRSLSKSISKK